MSGYYPAGISGADPDAPWNQEIPTPEEVAKSLHPNTAWYAMQIYRALSLWKEETPEVFSHFKSDPIEAMTMILNGLEEWF